MFVDPAMLKTGATYARNASEHAQAGVTELDQRTVTAGIFGSFGAADVFHQAISNSHAEHVSTLNDHRRTLSDVGDKAHCAQRVFTGMDQAAAAQLRAVRCNSSI